jgi:DNA replication protein DnaC
VELDRGLKDELPATQVRERLFAIEVAATRERRQRERLRFARYPVHKTLAEFDLDFQPAIDRKVVAELSTLRFVEERRNVILVGCPGSVRAT